MPLPYYKRFPRDFLEGTIGLSFQEKGAYAILLDLIYMRGGRLENDPRYIAAQLGCSVRFWKVAREGLLAKGKIEITNGVITNLRADEEIKQASAFSRKQAENASKVDRKLIESLSKSDFNFDENETKIINFNGLSEPKTCHTESESESDTEREKILTPFESKKSVKKTHREGAYISEDYRPSSAVLEAALAQGWSEAELEGAIREFVNYWSAEAGQRARKRNWDTTFRNRLAELEKRRGGSRSPVGVAVPSQDRRSPTSFADIIMAKRQAGRGTVIR